MNKNKLVSLKIDWATYEAAEYACKMWHYSKCMPVGKLVKLGVWENDSFIGTVIFGRGAAPKLASSFDLDFTELAELVRVSLKEHLTPVTRIMSLSIKFLKKACPGLRLLVSFADPTQGHHGGIYQGANWIYYGLSDATGGFEYLINGKWTTCRSIGSSVGTRKTKEVENKIHFTDKRKAARKHRYAYPIDKDLIPLLLSRQKPYPKRAVSKDNVAVVDQTTEDGVIPITALHL